MLYTSYEQLAWTSDRHLQNTHGADYALLCLLGFTASNALAIFSAFVLASFANRHGRIMV